MLALGPCSGLNSIASVAVNELTTIASIWPLAPFMSGIPNVGTSSTNPTGLANAFLAVNKLVNIGTGALPGPALPTGAPSPPPRSTPSPTSFRPASTPPAAPPTTAPPAGPSSASPPAPTTSSLPTPSPPPSTSPRTRRNVAALNNLVTAKPAFLPTLGNTPPAAWTIALRYPVAGTPTGIAADQSGNFWIANAASHAVTKLDTTGALIATYASGQSGNGAIAIDQSGNAWVGQLSGSILQITPAGVVSTFTGAA